MALFARTASCLRRNVCQLVGKNAKQSAIFQRSYVAGVDDVLFGLTEDQIQVFNNLILSGMRCFLAATLSPNPGLNQRLS